MSEVFLNKTNVKKCRTNVFKAFAKLIVGFMMAWMESVYQFVLIVLLLCVFGSGTAQISDEFELDVVGRCVQKCPFQNRTDDGHYDFGCGTECGIEQCGLGCFLWNKALETSCQFVCNVTTDVLSARELYCVMGCNGALNYYFQMLKEKIGTPPAPALVADSLTATSLSLEWEGSRHSNLSYLVQWRYEELAGAWQYCRNQTWGHHSVVRVENLQPYTKYRFRVAVLLSPRHSDPIVSAPSVIISTLPSGSPTSAPIELRVTALDSHRISLSWEPGPFPNGPILSYVLRIAEMERNGYTTLKDLPASENTLFYMFQGLSPSVNYRVGVAMRNGEGEGPQATVMVTTLAQPTAVASQQPILIVGGSHRVVQQPADISGEPDVIYNTTNIIQGVGIDVRRDILFVSDSSGTVFKSSLSKISPSTAILTPDSIAYSPLDLSVDWLNSHLYILGQVKRANPNQVVRWQVMRCDFEGKGQTVAFAGFHSKPVHIEVDPYNGYLFWAVPGASGGLYRLDLADISNGVKHDITPDQILKEPNLGAFTVDHTNFRILVAHLKRNTVLSVSLDGREVSDFRTNTQSAMFYSVQSLSFANGLFYWINGKDVLNEEYYKEQDSYFHNIYPDLIDTFNTVMVAFNSSQPIPVAANPPTGLQGIMGRAEGHISWRSPHRLGLQGAGAWQHWGYILHIISGNSTIYKTLSGSTSYIAEDLKEDTVYIIKVAAVTSSGTGPWSSEFSAKTLPTSRSGLPSSILWSAKEGVVSSDLTGNNIHTLIHKSQLRDMHITDISWYKDQLYMVSNSSNVMWYNTTSNEKGWLQDMDNVGSLAVDWVGGKLYWSSPKQQLITRGNLRGGMREPVPIVTVGKELKLDSLEGFIYWNTGHAIECARLNGEHKFTYYPAQLFRKQVMGLTVDLQGKKLYWIVHGYEGTNLYKAPTADVLKPGMEVSGSLITSLSGTTITGPLCYFSQRLIWLQDDSNAVISDLSGQNRATLNAVTTTNVNMIAVVDPDLQMNPVDKEVINVIPESVDPTSISILGDWNTFNISWNPVTKVNYGQVFYEIKIEYNHNIHQEHTTTEAMITYEGGMVPPYSPVEMSVRAYTYWGAAGAMRVGLHSPQAPPMPPTRPRLFVLHNSQLVKNDTEASIVFRWDRPIHANGIVRGYSVHCWYSGGGAPSPTVLPPQQYEHTLRGVHTNVTYYCQVQAFTDAGYGPKTHTVSSATDTESPVPRLAISFFDSIKVADLDLGEGHTYTVSRSPGKPEDFAVSLRERMIYWMNQEQEIYVSRMDKTGHTKVLSINGTALSLTVDWVARMLYWSQVENSPDQYECMLYRMDLNIYDREGLVKLERILQRNLHIKRLQVSPVTRSLYWIEMNHHGLGKLMTSDIDGTNIRPFFGGRPAPNNTIDYRGQPAGAKPCNCPENPAVGLGFTIDLTNPKSRKIYWTDAWLKHITASDMNGCYCKVLVNATRWNDHALPPTSITVDSKYIYWTNSSQKQMHSMEKNSDRMNRMNDINITNGQKIVALGSKIQPYPNKNCLYPKQAPLQVKLMNRTSTSLTLELPQVLKYEMCANISMATPYYTVYYQPYSEDDALQCNETACTKVRTFENKLYLGGLIPFSKYVFSVQISNYYGDAIEVKSIMGPPVVLRTSAGAPPSAVDVKAVVLSPHHARVQWKLPPPSTSAVGADQDLDLWHEIHWRTEGNFKPNQRIKEHIFIAKTKSPSNQTTTQADLLKLMPSQKYSVWVRTYSYNSDEQTDSEIVSIETYPEPSDIVANFSGPYVMHVSWMPYKDIHTSEHYIEYTEMGSEAWKAVEDEGSKKSDGSINYVVQNLLPKTQYKFRIKIVYLNNTTPYIWPQDSKFLFETLGDRPSNPGKPVVQHLSGSVYQLQWAASAPHGSPVLLYRLYGHSKPSEGDRIRTHRNVRAILTPDTDTEPTRESFPQWTRQDKEMNNKSSMSYWNGERIFEYEDLVNTRNKRKANYSLPQSDLPYFSVEDNADSMLMEATDEPLKEGWKMLYNGTDNYWIIADLKLSERYTFNVQALNSYGWSDMSEPSDEFDFSEAELMVVHQDYLAIVLGIGISILGALGLGIGVCVCLIKRRDKKSLHHSIPTSTLRGPDMELATLRELPRSRGGGGMFQQSVLYGRGGACQQEGADMTGLVHIRRDQITLSKFLGSGAFGEVFEGKSSETRVAIKTLRKGATDQEKSEFLQEAQLMSNFRHKHILSLLGVCLDNDPHFIIMELMEAGDLLGYLRSRRPMLYTNDSLTLGDLLSMCLDVTSGCCYLEEMHFVHRDLACRNCLVSHHSTGRIVKIGDFGLTRDIYKNDYYRKEGEGLLPVRWMAVECLTDGVFSRASDVWAWAVLCWEVCALGMQPYAALSNHAVMRYVQGGGTLLRPLNCPQELFELMQKCWSYNPDHRPTFKHCLEVLQHLMASLNGDTVLTISINDEPQYITVVADGVNNRAYFMDENQNNFSGDSDFINESTQISSEASQSQEVGPEGPPKYLELIYHGESLPVCVDGYEVPRSSIRSNASRKMFNGDIPQTNSSRGSIQRRQSFNTMENRHSINRRSLNRSNSTSRHPENGRCVNFIPTSSTAQVHYPSGFKVPVLESDLNHVVYRNSLRLSGQFGDNSGSRPASLQTFVPNGILKNSISRTNSGTSHTSDEDRITSPSRSEQRRLLNTMNGFATADRLDSSVGNKTLLRTIT